LFVFTSRRQHTRSKRDWISDVCSSDLFDHEFKPSVLEGKTLVIGDDVPVGVNIEDSSNFNSVVTGDSILVNVKKKQPYRAVFRCTVIQSTNGMPRFKNKTGGTNRRLIIVPFKIGRAQV